MEKMESKMLSLYDYLGKAAGQKIGIAVSRAAGMSGEAVGVREVRNKKYSGKVHLYRREFLEAFFQQ